MRTFLFSKTLLIVGLAASCAASLLSTATFAAVGNATKAAQPAQLQQTYTWHDGTRERSAWLDPQLLVEFKTGKKTAPGNTGHAGANTAPTVKSVYTQATAVGKAKGGIQLWRMGAGVTSDQAAQVLTARTATETTPTNYSPVLRDSASPNSRMRALPGNIIVYLNPSWDSATVDTWALGKQLEIVNKLTIGDNVYVIKTPPGLASLAVANSLHQSGEVLAAIPNWWQPLTTK